MTHPHLGARRRPDQGLRLRRLRRRCVPPPARAGPAASVDRDACPAAALSIEWRDDDHVVMTGPAEWEFSGSFDPATGGPGTRDRQDVA